MELLDPRPSFESFDLEKLKKIINNYRYYVECDSSPRKRSIYIDDLKSNIHKYIKTASEMCIKIININFKTFSVKFLNFKI